MHSVTIAPSAHSRHQVLRIQAFTVVWMIIEMAVSLVAGWRAGSPALLAFGGDSAIELFSAAVILWRFRSERVAAGTEKLAARINGALLFALAAYVIVISGATLLRHLVVRPSPLGIGLLLASAVIMPVLASRKRQLSVSTSSAALRADASESAVCGYLAWIALVGLIANAVGRVQWADPVAAFGLVPLIVREGWQSFKGTPCDCC